MTSLSRVVKQKILLLSFGALIATTALSPTAHAGSPNITPPLPICNGFGICPPCAAVVAAKEAEEWYWPAPPVGPTAGTYVRVSNHIRSEFTAMKVWMTSIFWEDNVLPAMMLMAEQLTSVAMQQAQIVGSFMDAKHQLETQQSMEVMRARAHKDYHPSVGVCEFGSSAKSLAASERKAELANLAMSQRAVDRGLGAINTAAATGKDGDMESRIKQFREKFCDPMDNNNGLEFMCEHDQDQNIANSTRGNDPGSGIGAAKETPPNPPGGPRHGSSRMNKDIDFVRTVDSPWTLDLDFTNPGLTGNEEEVLALAANLYGHEVFFRPPARGLKNTDGSKINPMQSAYLDMRSALAKRSVAQNSFNAITAMKAAGTPGSRDYLVELIKQLGVRDDEEIKKLLGKDPSYYAQMEVLTKKLFQNPDFFTNLYDTPANVDRKGVAVQAIGLMQKFDIYKSYLRNEATLSILLELAVQDLQGEVENEMNQIKGQGSRAEN